MNIQLYFGVDGRVPGFWPCNIWWPNKWFSKGSSKQLWTNNHEDLCRFDHVRWRCKIAISCQLNHGGLRHDPPEFAVGHLELKHSGCPTAWKPPWMHPPHAAVSNQLGFFFLMGPGPASIFEVLFKTNFLDLAWGSDRWSSVDFAIHTWWSFHDRNYSPRCWRPLLTGIWTGQNCIEANLTNNSFGFNLWTCWTRGLQQRKTIALTRSNAAVCTTPEITGTLLCPGTWQAGKSPKRVDDWMEAYNGL